MLPPPCWTGTARWLRDPKALACALGEVLSEPKPGATFEALPPQPTWVAGFGVVLDRRSRMLYDDWHVFINGESFRAGGRDARLMRAFADARAMTAAEVSRLSGEARELLAQWLAQGWARPISEPHDGA